MKIIILVLVIMAFLHVSITFASHPCQEYSIVGVYSNADYNGERTVAKVDIYYNCYVHLYEYTTSTEYIRIGQLLFKGYEEVEDGVWSISAVTEYFAGNNNEHKDNYYILFKFTITDTKGFLETVWSKEYYPDVVSPNDATYGIYYRQE